MLRLHVHFVLERVRHTSTSPVDIDHVFTELYSITESTASLSVSATLA